MFGGLTADKVQRRMAAGIFSNGHSSTDEKIRPPAFFKLAVLFLANEQKIPVDSQCRY